MALVCTPGGPTDNSYVTLAQASTYFANSLRAATWDGYEGAQRELALMQATSEIEALGGARAPNSPTRPLFSGYPFDRMTPQGLHFPRGGDRTLVTQTLTIPESVQAAVCEQAFWLLDRQANAPLLDRQQLQAEGVASVSVDGLSEQYRPTGVPMGISVVAWGFMRVYVRRGSYPTVVR